MTVQERAEEMFEKSFPRLRWWEQLRHVKEVWEEKARESDANVTQDDGKGSPDAE